MIEPRYWIIEFADALPAWLDWFGAWLVDRETDRILGAIGPALDGVALLACLSAGRGNPYQNATELDVMKALMGLGQTAARAYTGF